jgi:hypothetical protein
MSYLRTGTGNFCIKAHTRAAGPLAEVPLLAEVRRSAGGYGE